MLTVFLIILYSYFFIVKILYPSVADVSFRIGEKNSEIDRFATENYFKIKAVEKRAEISMDSDDFVKDIFDKRYKLKSFEMYDLRAGKKYVLEYNVKFFKKSSEYFAGFSSVHHVMFVKDPHKQYIKHKFDVSISKSDFDKLNSVNLVTAT